MLWLLIVAGVFLYFGFVVLVGKVLASGKPEVAPVVLHVVKDDAA